MTILITGASSGIGRDMARLLSRAGKNLILTARNERELRKLKSEFETEYKNKVEIIPLDLSKDDAPFELYNSCKSKNISMLINNAGFGVFGKFAVSDLQSELDMLKVNIRAVHILTKLFLKDFREKNSGIILNVASSAGFMPGPLLASYYASKSYVVNLTVAINEELRREKSKVKVSLLCPGPVDTKFNQRAGVNFNIKSASSEYVAKYALEQTFKNKLIIVPTVRMKVAVFTSRLVPMKPLAAIAYNIQKRKE